MTLIETRGEGGYCITAPTPGYKPLRGEMTAIPSITPQERSILHESARALNRYTPSVIGQPRQILRPTFADPRPGDTFNKHGDPLPFLEGVGWHVVRQCDKALYLCRPGKAQGVSATLGYVGPNVLYVFSSNAAPFESNRAYSPFAVYAFLEHDRDFLAAARALREQGYTGYCYPSAGR